MTERLKQLWQSVSAAERLTMAVIAVAYTAVLGVGLTCSEPMIGDEVTHYYMLMTQAKNLPAPTIKAEIPLASGRSEKREYPHVFFWHYGGAVLVKVFGASFPLVQVYHSLFWLQFLIVSWLLVRKEPGQSEWSTLVTVAVLASLPTGLLFSVVFYQDIPAIAQLLTSFFFLRRRKLWHSILFMCLALNMKETAFVLLPAYLLCIFFFFPDTEARWKSWARAITAGFVILLLTVSMAVLFKYHLKAAYYPRTIIDQCLNVARNYGFLPKVSKPARPDHVAGKKRVSNASLSSVSRKVKKNYPKIANNPGDLRKPINYLIYGGGLFWLVVLAGGAGLASSWRQCVRSHGWWLLTGCWFLVCTAWMMRMAPDARFFLPGVVFLVPPLVCEIKALHRSRILAAVVLVLALGQGAVVLAKTWQTRRVPSGVIEAVNFLKQHPLETGRNRVFMYPEGNYRLFPCGHEWYFSWRIKEFWKADNDGRIRMLHEFRLGAIVIKKYRVARIDPGMSDLGVYPDFFVRDIEGDKRFTRIYENSDVVIYLVPAPPSNVVPQAVNVIEVQKSDTRLISHDQ